MKIVKAQDQCCAECGMPDKQMVCFECILICLDCLDKAMKMFLAQLAQIESNKQNSGGTND